MKHVLYLFLSSHESQVYILNGLNGRTRKSKAAWINRRV
jgi:hypothetical protein